MKTLVALLVLQSIALSQPLPGGGLENGAPHRYLCGRSTMPVVIDGQLADPAWCDQGLPEFSVRITRGRNRNDYFSSRFWHSDTPVRKMNR